MIVRITRGKVYRYRGKRVRVIERKKGVLGWFQDRVLVEYPDGTQEYVGVKWFREEANYLDP